jgi:hypothetical protein
MEAIIMKKYLIILIVALSPILLSGQQESNVDQSLIPPSYNSSSAATGFNTALAPVHFNMVTGMNFGTFGNGGYMQSFLSPSFIMPLNKKLSVSAGVTYSNTQYNNVPMVGETGKVESHSGGLNTLTLHTSGLYRVNEKLTFTGSAFKTLNPALNTRLNPSTIQMEAQGFSVGVGYKLSENTYIGAEIRYQESNSNIMNPYSNPYYNTYPGTGLSPFNSNRINPFGF